MIEAGQQKRVGDDVGKPEEAAYREVFWLVEVTCKTVRHVKERAKEKL